jgi:hypothetical protein
MGCLSRASIECTDHMLIYEPSKSSSLMSIEGDFTLTASMAGSGEKLGTNPWIGQPSCCGLCRESFFSGAVDLSIDVDDFMKSCYTWTTWDTYDRESYVDWAWKACDVLVRFSPVGCTLIWIASTLSYEYRLFHIDNLMNLFWVIYST